MAELHVPNEVVDSLETLRESGACNMFDCVCAFDWLTDNGHHETAAWLFEGEDRSDMRKRYAAAINAFSRRLKEQRGG